MTVTQVQAEQSFEATVHVEQSTETTVEITTQQQTVEAVMDQKQIEEPAVVHLTKDDIDDYEESQAAFRELWEKKREKVSKLFPFREGFPVSDEMSLTNCLFTAQCSALLAISQAYLTALESHSTLERPKSKFPLLSFFLYLKSF